MNNVKSHDKKVQLSPLTSKWIKLGYHFARLVKNSNFYYRVVGKKEVFHLPSIFLFCRTKNRGSIHIIGNFFFETSRMQDTFWETFFLQTRLFLVTPDSKRCEEIIHEIMRKCTNLFDHTWFTIVVDHPTEKEKWFIRLRGNWFSNILWESKLIFEKNLSRPRKRESHFVEQQRQFYHHLPSQENKHSLEEAECVHDGIPKLGLCTHEFLLRNSLIPRV